MIQATINLDQFGILTANLPGHLDTGIVIAASRRGAGEFPAYGILNLEGTADLSEAQTALARVDRLAHADFGVKFDAGSQLTIDLVGSLPPFAKTVIFTSTAPQLGAWIEQLHAEGRRVFAEVTGTENAAAAEALGVDGLIAKGQEAGGIVGEETSFILLQRFLRERSLPIYVHGGIGPHSVAACFTGGAAGVVLDSQLLLTRESDIPSKLRAALERSGGDETFCLGREVGALTRVWKRPGMRGIEELEALELALGEKTKEAAERDWRDFLLARTGWKNPELDIWVLGQDSALAASFGARFGTIAGVIDGLRDAIREHVSLAKELAPLGRGSAMAVAHHTDYPILQGPMTRVSDTAEFANFVAEGGGLPFLALALLRGPQVRRLMEKTRDLAGSKSWGAGILGFVSPELREEQLAVVRDIKPPYALIAGGRPDQAASLEKIGIKTYLHVPAPPLLKMFMEDGARRFIFEGRECGGHVGPRTSFVLWETMIDTLLDAIAVGAKGLKAEDLHIVFAGGIHDAQSAAMVSTMAAPLAAKGVKIGVLMGTAYLFTKEAVTGGAIVDTFQQEAVNCRHTVILESGPGHATRCVDTTFADQFRAVKRKMQAEGKSHEEIKDALEALNVGRLRIASKGIDREGQGASVSYKQVSSEDQLGQGMYMIGQIASLRSEVTSVRDLHESVSAGSAEWLRHVVAPEQTPAYEFPPEPPCDLAIVGVSCMMPKAKDVREFWANIVGKVNAITEIPKSRFDADRYFDADKKARDKMYTRWGGFLADVAFDPMRYGIPPNALQSIDPMQLLALVAVEEALKDASLDTNSFDRTKASVILGMSGGLGDVGLNYAVRTTMPEYIENVPESVLSQMPEWTEDTFAGILLNVTAGRIANRFDFGGVNFTVDAACASSLAALSIGARELTSGSSDVVITGGIDTLQSPFGFMCFAKSQALSPRGQCRPFDETADGIAISEGVTMLVLKRLKDAERSGDRVYAVVKGVAGSSDGRGRSMTAPRPEGQMAVLRRAYRQAGFGPSTVGLFEAHGTGTAAGDAAEITSLSETLLADGAQPGLIAVGSVKSMVGHTKAAAGVTGLLKVALALYHKVLPATINVEKPNARLKDPVSPVYANTETRPWVRMTPETPLRAGVSSFGFGGTNFHAVLEEYTGDLRHPEQIATVEQWPAELFVLAGSAQSITTALTNLTSASAYPLRNLAAQTASRLTTSKTGVRLAIIAHSHEDLAAKCIIAKEALAQGQTALADKSGIYLAAAPSGAPKVAFLFPGQGSQQPNMLRDLAVFFPEFRLVLDRANQVLAGRFSKPLSAFIYPTPVFTPEEEKRQMTEITATAVAQPALGVVEFALTRVLARLGIRPAMTAGHSYGEYAALAAAGVLTEDALFELSERRGNAIEEATRGGDAGTMAAVLAEAGQVEAALNGASGVTVANLNSPKQTIIAGAKLAIEAAMTKLASQNLTAKAIPVACAFHSPLMQPAQARLAAVLERQTYQTPTAQVFSNTLAAPYPEESSAIAELLASHLVKPVRFVDQIRAMHDAGARVFIEVGPKNVLSNLAKQNLEGRDVVILQTDSTERRGIEQLQHVLAQLFLNGVSVEWEELFRGRVEPFTPPAKPAQWMVNGGGTYAVGKPPAPKRPVKLVDPATIKPEVRTIEVVKEVVKEVVREVAVPSASHGSPTPFAGGSENVIVEYQRMMQQFLTAQTSIMQSFLTGAAAPMVPASPVATRPAPVIAVAPAPKPQAPQPVAPKPVAPKPVAVEQDAALLAAEAAPVVSKPVAAAAVKARDVLTDLVAIVSDRTGYPADMLDPNAAIEADLGIDSIKRVEVLSAFQRTCSEAEQKQIQTTMEKLTGARTLNEMAERLAPIFASVPVPPVIPAAVPQSRDVLSELVTIVSDRTGYPADMLDPNAAIEADLGIDSIKRVEVLSAFQRTCSEAEQSQIQGVMEKLTGARTLNEMVERLAPLFAKASAPAAVLSVPAAAAAPTKSRDVLSELIAIVSDRTGYPPDMLDANAAIEADLGIDSIKRVEVLSAFQRTCSDAEQSQIQAVMEKLTGARTLNEMAERLAPLFAKTAAPTAVQPVPAPAAPPTKSRDVLSELISIVSDRTGYPPDMLDANAAIEADLGIDSIKRVEVLSAFQRTCSDAEQSQIQGVMEKLTGARTLNEMAERLAPLFASALTASAPAQPTAAAAAPTKSRDVLSELIAIVSDRTGYPPDMLDANAAIEADLGIDSIKRVEVLSAFQRSCSDAEQTQIQLVMEKLTSARTLHEISERIASAWGTAVPAAPFTPPAADGPVESVARFTLATVSRPRGGVPKHFPGRVVVVTDDENGVAAGLAETLKAAGERVLVARHSIDATLHSEGVYSTDLTSPEQIDTMLATVRAEYGPIGAIIHLLPLQTGTPFAQLDLAGWRAQVRQDVRSLFLLAKAAESDLKRLGKENGALLAAVTARGGEFGLAAGSTQCPTHFAVADFLKTVSLEFNEVLCKVVDVDAADPLAVLHTKLAEELCSTDDTLQVGLAGDSRLTVIPQVSPLAAAPLHSVDANSVVLLTGGARGITAGIAKTLARKTKPTLILAGASALPPDEPAATAALTEPAQIKAALMQQLRASGKTVKPADVEAAYGRLNKNREIRRNLAELRTLGSTVEYHAVDVRDEAAFGKLIDQIYTQFGRLDVVIHGAGLIEDKLIKDKTPESFDRVVHTKTDSSFVLTRKLRPSATGCLIFMSSITAAFGNRGQADYAAANGVMNGLATMLAGEWPGHVVAMNWGPWDQGGMVSDDVRRQFLAQRIEPIVPAEGDEAVMRELALTTQGNPVAVFGEGPWRHLAVAGLGDATPPILKVDRSTLAHRPV